MGWNVDWPEHFTVQMQGGAENAHIDCNPKLSGSHSAEAAVIISAYSISLASATLAFGDITPFQAGHQAGVTDIAVVMSAYFVTLLLSVTPASME